MDAAGNTQRSPPSVTKASVGASPSGDIDVHSDALMRRIGTQRISHVLGSHAQQYPDGRAAEGGKSLTVIYAAAA